MNDLFNLENYKNYLIEVYRYEIDNNDFSKNKRREQLANWYSDEFLQSIIDDTLNFSIYLLECNLNKETHWCDIDLLEDAGYIHLNLSGGWFSDILYTINCEGKEITISRHLLITFLGEKFFIEEDSHIEPVTDEGDDFTIYNEYYYPFIRITGDFQKLQEKLEQLRMKRQNDLVLVLKRKLEKID